MRIGHQFNILNRKKDITNDFLNEYITWHNEKNPDLPMTKNEVVVEITTFFCNFGLVHYEFLKRFFIETLLLEKLKEKSPKIKLGNVPTYGALVKAFRELPNYNVKMDEFFDEGFRNALAHDTWYFEKEGLAYRDMKNEITVIPFPKIPDKIFTISKVYTLITSNYFQDYAPEAVDFWNKHSSEVNKHFPLYGMSELQ
ncbi:hypothetical protein [Candidatus Nitrosopumilus sediminis]|uniref:hypothetical protein n=1 Tax=Candidatus Nitrosopumilus sediminis TaxID=1229909 RepID=UPI000ADF77B8|nr:hypothetical protein [Candidatus Nitrosopumilus sediminis]